MTGLAEELEFLRTNEAAGNGTGTVSEHESESNLTGNEHLLKTLRELENMKALMGATLCGIKDAGVGRPPSNRVKTDPEKAMMDDMYQGVGGTVPRRASSTLKLVKEQDC